VPNWSLAPALDTRLHRTSQSLVGGCVCGGEGGRFPGPLTSKAHPVFHILSYSSRPHSAPLDLPEKLPPACSSSPPSNTTNVSPSPVHRHSWCPPGQAGAPFWGVREACGARLAPQTCTCASMRGSQSNHNLQLAIKQSNHNRQFNRDSQFTIHSSTTIHDARFGPSVWVRCMSASERAIA